MKIAVTGHTQGLGKAFFDHYISCGHYVQGFSRSTGFDLRDWSDLQKFLALTEDFDITISNAKPDFSQTVLLYESYKKQHKCARIISIGSGIINHNVDPALDVGINLYKTQKLSLVDAHRQLTQKSKKFDSILVHPSHLYNNGQQIPPFEYAEQYYKETFNK
jgi:hypothetical protein